MNVTVQVIGSPEDVAIFLREIGGKGALTAESNPVEVHKDVIEDTVSVENPSEDADQGPEKISENPFEEVPDPGQDAMGVVPSESVEEEKSSVTYAQLQHAMKAYALRYQQRHPELGTFPLRDLLYRICEEIGGSGKGEGSKGIKKSRYDTVYKFFIEDQEL